MADQPVSMEVLGLTAQIVAAHVSNNAVPTDHLPSLIQDIYRALSGMGREAPVVQEKPAPAVPVKKSIFPDYLVCLEDGKKLKMLKRHLSTAYGMTPEQYREKWGAELCQTSLIAGQADRAGHQAARQEVARFGVTPPSSIRARPKLMLGAWGNGFIPPNFFTHPPARQACAAPCAAPAPATPAAAPPGPARRRSRENAVPPCQARPASHPAPAATRSGRYRHRPSAARG